MRLIWAILWVGVVCAGCNPTSNYAANQVLGSAASPINPRLGRKLEAGGVYQFTERGTQIRHCTEDFKKNKALSGVKIQVVEASDEARTDQIGIEGVSVGIPGIPTLRVPYDKSRITGYKVTSASVDGVRYQDFVYRGVGAKCRSIIDRGGIVVAKEARATKTTRLMRGPVAGTVTLGVATIGGLDAELSINGPSNVTFGIVPASAE